MNADNVRKIWTLTLSVTYGVSQCP